jgi:hypothetical protein
MAAASFRLGLSITRRQVECKWQKCSIVGDVTFWQAAGDSQQADVPGHEERKEQRRPEQSRATYPVNGLHPE